MEANISTRLPTEYDPILLNSNITCRLYLNLLNKLVEFSILNNLYAVFNFETLNVLYYRFRDRHHTINGRVQPLRKRTPWER